MNTEINQSQLNSLRAEVETLVADVERTHRYSMSRIYGLYNQVHGTDEKPQSCSSCLIRKVRQLKSWLSELSEIAPEGVIEEVVTATIHETDNEDAPIVAKPKKGRKKKSQ